MLADDESGPYEQPPVWASEDLRQTKAADLDLDLLFAISNRITERDWHQISG